MMTEQPALSAQTVVPGWHMVVCWRRAQSLKPDGSHQLGRYQLHDLSHYAKVARPVARNSKSGKASSGTE